jgi:hypothetical protein
MLSVQNHDHKPCEGTFSDGIQDGVFCGTRWKTPSVRRPRLFVAARGGAPDRATKYECDVEKCRNILVAGSEKAPEPDNLWQ